MIRIIRMLECRIPPPTVSHFIIFDLPKGPKYMCFFLNYRGEGTKRLVRFVKGFRVIESLLYIGICLGGENVILLFILWPRLLNKYLIR